MPPDKLLRFVIFGSYITDKPEPRDVDIILIVSNDFSLDECEPENQIIFYHREAEESLGASIFWTTPAAVLLESVDEFIAYWQTKRDGGSRGIVEVIL